MGKSGKIPPRGKVKKEDTWDLSPLFKSDSAWESACKKLEKKIELYNQFRGKLGSSAQTLKKCLEMNVDFDKQAERLGNYAFLRSSENVADSGIRLGNSFLPQRKSQ